jgi:hypothetical protein
MSGPRLPAGHPPWEPLNGIRIGGIAGLALGAVLALLFDTAALAFIIGGTVVGAVVGYLVAKRQMRLPPPPSGGG